MYVFIYIILVLWRTHNFRCKYEPNIFCRFFVGEHQELAIRDAHMLTSSDLSVKQTSILHFHFSVHKSTLWYSVVLLLNNYFHILEYSTENLRQCLVICLAHLLLAPELVMRTHGIQLIQVLDGIMSDMKNEGIIVLMRLVETFVRALPGLGTETVVPILPRIFQ